MDHSRLFVRLLIRTERLLDRLNTLLSFVYVSLVVLLIGAITFIYVHFLYPLIHKTLEPSHALVHTALSVYFLGSVLLNYIQCLATPAGSPPRTSDPEAAAAAATTKTPPDGLESQRTRSETWRYCTICRSTKPPRAHHCTPCGACFHKLCHHCPALGKCVGRDNHPYFFRFVLSAWWGALFAAATCAYLRKSLPGTLTGRVEDALFFTAVGGCAVGVAVGVLGAWHVYLMLTGQTTIEWLENVEARRRGAAPAEWGRWGGPFSTGIRGNVREAFGEVPYRFVPWWTVLFVPVGRYASWE